jgi:hypothetical protein
MSTSDPTSIRDLLGRVRAVHIGVDLGQTVDFSAIAVVEVGERPSDRMYKDWRTGKMVPVPEATYRVQRLQRLDLGTAWVLIAARVVDVVASLWDWEKKLRTAGALLPNGPQLPWDIWADATGVGKPIMELIANGLEAEPRTRRARLHPVKFYHGDEFRRGQLDDGTTDALGKAYLVSRLQSLAQAEPPLLRLPPRDPEAQTMMQELKDYRIKVDTDANDRYGAFSTGAHDDLVTALGLACIEEPGYYSVESGPNLWP